MKHVVRAGFIFGMIAFGITLAIIIGQRLSSEAMAVLLGVVTGIVSSVPTSLLIVWIATRNIAKRIDELAHTVTPPAAPAPSPKEEPMPRVILMQQPAPAMNAYAQAPQQGWAQAAASPMNPPRRFTVIGGNEESSVRISEVE